MGKIEREIKILNVDVKSVKSKLEELGISPKGKYIQDVYTFDLPTVDELYVSFVNKVITSGDKRGFIKLINEIKPCFDKKDIDTIKKVLGTSDFIKYIDDGSDLKKLLSEELIEMMKKTNENFSKWVRLRKTENDITITIKKIVNSKGIYELDAVDELEFDVPSIEEGKEFLEDLGYFFERHQTKMRIAYDYKNTEIVIDKWPRLSPYIEVEGPTKKEIEEVVKMLGYDVKDAIVINTDDVYNMEGIDIYSKEYANLEFTSEEEEEINEYLND